MSLKRYLSLKNVRSHRLNIDRKEDLHHRIVSQAMLERGMMTFNILINKTRVHRSLRLPGFRVKIGSLST